MSYLAPEQLNYSATSLGNSASKYVSAPERNLPAIREVAEGKGGGANLLLLCESPTAFSKQNNTNTSVRQEQHQGIRFNGTFQGIKRTEPKPTKLAPISHVLARSLAPSKSNPWKKRPKPVTETVIRRMNRSESKMLQNKSLNESRSPSLVPTTNFAGLEAEYRLSSEAETVKPIREKGTGKLRETSTFVRHTQDALASEGSLAYDNNALVNDISGLGDQGGGGGGNSQGGGKMVLMFSSSDDDDDDDFSASEDLVDHGTGNRDSPKAGKAVAFSEDPVFGQRTKSIVGGMNRQAALPPPALEGSAFMLGTSPSASRFTGGSSTPKWLKAAQAKQKLQLQQQERYMHNNSTSKLSMSGSKYLMLSGSGTPSPTNAMSMKMSRKELRRLESTVAADHSQKDIALFESVVDERTAFEEFLQPRPRTIPNMVIKQFRHHLNADSELVQKLRALPLRQIEKVVDDLQGARALTLTAFNTFLNKLLGENTYSKVESQQMFCYFDTDGDGDVDMRELCNGLVLALSEDGPLVGVLHRCQSMVKPRTIRDTRLNSMSRFELVVISEAITHTTKNPVTGEPDQEVVSELQGMLQQFRCDKKGQFPFDQVKKRLQESDVLSKQLNSFTVPREKHLFESFLSHFYRTTDAEEGDSVFRLMKTEKTDRRVQQEAQKNAITQGLERPPEDFLSNTTNTGKDKGEDEEPKTMTEGGDENQADGPAKAEGSTDSAPTEEPTTQASTLRFKKKSAVERPVAEPGNPKYWTNKGLLYRQVEGEEPQRIQGALGVKYTLDPKEARKGMFS